MIIGSHAGYRSQISPTISMPRHSVRCVQSELWKQFFIPSASPIINSAVSGSPRFSIEMTIANEAVILENNYLKNEWIPNSLLIWILRVALFDGTRQVGDWQMQGRYGRYQNLFKFHPLPVAIEYFGLTRQTPTTPFSDPARRYGSASLKCLRAAVIPRAYKFLWACLHDCTGSRE